MSHFIRLTEVLFDPDDELDGIPPQTREICLSADHIVGFADIPDRHDGTRAVVWLDAHGAKFVEQDSKEIRVRLNWSEKFDPFGVN